LPSASWLLSSTVCATSIQPVYGAYPERLPSDLTALYLWNEPPSILILEFVCVSAPVLFVSVQLLFSLSLWLRLGQKRLACQNILENEIQNVVYTCIRENPGIRMRSLSQMLGVSIGSLRYHVGVLCQMPISIASLNTLADRKQVSLPEEALSYALRARGVMYLRIFINISRTCKEIGQNL